MRTDAIEHGFATLRVLTGPDQADSKPIGVVAWDRERKWYGIRLMDAHQRPRSIKKSVIGLVEFAGRDLKRWARENKVPYGAGEAPPWSGDFWLNVHQILRSAVQLDAPTAMHAMQEPEEELDLLFEAVAKPRSRKKSTRIEGYLNEALGDIGKRFEKRESVGAFKGRDETVKRAAISTSAAVLIEAVNLASRNGRRDADALVSKVERILEGQSDRRDVRVVVGYAASPGGLNGESDMRDWIDVRIAPGRTFDLIHQREAFRETARDLLLELEIDSKGLFA